MNSHKHKTRKKSFIKKRNSIKQNVSIRYKKVIRFFSSINYKSTIKDLLNRLLYFFLILVAYPISSIFLFSLLVKGILHSLNIISIFAFILNLMVFAKIISLRSNWATLYFKYPQPLSWKYILLKQKSFGVISSFWISCGISYVIFDNISRVVYHTQAWTNTMIENYELILTLITIGFIIFVIETFFFIFTIFEKGTYHILFKNTAKTKDANFDRESKNQPISASATFNITNSVIVLGLVLISSILFAKIVSGQINNYFLDSTSFNLDILLFSAILALLFSTYFIISLNNMIFKKFKWEHDINIKRNMPTLLLCFFIFMNAIYFSEYLAVFMFYVPIDANDPATIMLSKTLSSAGKPWLEDKFFVALTTFMDYIIFSVISAIFVYVIFFVKTSKMHIVEVLEKTKRIMVSSNKPNSKSNVIEKLFSKQLRNQNFVKYYSLFFYIYAFGIEAIFAFILFFYAKYDDMFGAETFKIAINGFIYETIIYTSLLPVLGAIYSQSQVYYQYPLRHFISRSNWQNFVKILLIYYPIVFLYPITIFINDVYRISKQYGNIVPPENIQVMQSIFSVFVLGFLSINIYPKIEEFLMNLYDHDFYNELIPKPKITPPKPEL